MNRIAQIITIMALLLVSVAETHAAPSWPQVRDRAMSLREAGRATEAYALVSAASPTRADERADKEFVAGFLALRSLNAAPTAMQHFSRMAQEASPLRGWSGESTRSKAGFWLGETLTASGRTADANKLYAVASQYRDTFYGMLSASKVASPTADTTARVSRVAGRYPRPEIAWHDSRIASELVFAVIKAESEFKPRAVSPKGAQGLMQVMPDTAKHVGRQAGIAIDVHMLGRDGNYNVAIGSKYLADLVSSYGGNIPMAAAAYNAGESRVSNWVSRFGDPRGGASSIEWIELIPFKETREYVQKVYSNYLAYLALQPR